LGLGVRRQLLRGGTQAFSIAPPSRYPRWPGSVPAQGKFVVVPKTSRVGVVGALVVVLAISLCALALVPLGAAAADSRAAASPGEAATGRIGWRACGEQLECARGAGALGLGAANGRKIRLAVIRHRASRPEQRIGSLFFNPGGPGQSGVDAVTEAARAWTPWARVASTS
jgi:hypothetical protein